MYKIPCTCGSYYIGQTGKTLKKRISQHKYNIDHDNQQSAINLHMRECNFNIDWGKADTLYKNSNYIERNIIESLCIAHRKGSNFNVSHALIRLDPIVEQVFSKQYRIHEVLPQFVGI